LLGASYAVPAVLFVTGQARAWVLLPFLTLVPGLVLGRQIARNEGRALNPTLVHTAKLLLGFGLLFAAGLALGGSP
jgi:1,4-dihydroxy-2-naphthoate octaprenyltransferase